MRNIIFLVVIMAAHTGCKKANYHCYDQVVDQQGNITAGTTGKVKKYFDNKADLMQWQYNNKKSCVEQH